MSQLPIQLPAALLAALQQAYATPPRAYHNFTHVAEVLGHFHSVPRWQDPGSVLLAILFHDAIYEAGRSDNEARSAALAGELLARHTPAFDFDLACVQTLILLTARHGALHAPLDQDSAHFLDCDMAILGAEPARYQAYEQAIAQEYGHLPTAQFRAGRAHFIRKLLASDAIYLSVTFQQRFEARARANLSDALEQLR